MKTCIIFNPAARGDKARRFRKYLDALASYAALKPSASAGNSRALAAEAVREGFVWWDGLAGSERNEDDLVACFRQRHPVPRPVERDERSAAIAGWELRTRIEHQPVRTPVRRESH